MATVPEGKHRLDMRISDELHATIARGAQRDGVRATDWVRQAIAAKGARGEALEYVADPETLRRISAVEQRLAALEKRLGLDR